MGRDRYPKQALGTLYLRIKDARVLLVGAGGIGCELLKNLVLTGYGEVHIVDLDTIDLSNLNRQFLFRHEHIKKSKAFVAKESASKFNPNVKLEAHHANIQDPMFNVEWFKSFQIVFNALDNLQARRHVNKMCLAADVPLIESGTTGFNGQVQVIRKGKTECYDCNPKQTPKTFPVCTIRSTPSQPIHCIVWAKSYLFTEIFGTSEDDSPDLDHSADSENAKELENLQKEAQALKRIRQSMGSDDFAKIVFEKVFTEDIKRLRGMEDMWKSRKQPRALNYEKLSESAKDVQSSVASEDQRTWTVEENFKVFKDSLFRLSSILREAQSSTSNGDGPAILTFDKDDKDTLDFVAAAANLRSLIFGIETKSEFDIKQMAGNIIPAIATTNAMVAGLCVLQAFRVMKDDLASARMIFLTKSADRIISADKLQPPNPNCQVCGVDQSHIHVDTRRATLKDLVEDFLRIELGYGEEFSVNNEVGTLYDPELDDNLDKKFSDLGIKGDSFLTVVDEDEDKPRINLVLSISEKKLPDDSKPIIALDRIKDARRRSPIRMPTTNGYGNGDSTEVTNGTVNKKRTAADAGLEMTQLQKRGKATGDLESDRKEEAIVLDDDAGTGAIVIDDD